MPEKHLIDTLIFIFSVPSAFAWGHAPFPKFLEPGREGEREGRQAGRQEGRQAGGQGEREGRQGECEGRQAGRGRWRACRSGVAKHLPSSFNLLHHGMRYNVALAT